MSVIEAARLIHRIAATGKELKLRFIPLREIFGSYKDIMRRVPDLRKAEAILGYRPKHTMEQAIRMTIDSIVRSERASK